MRLRKTPSEKLKRAICDWIKAISVDELTKNHGLDAGIKSLRKKMSQIELLDIKRR